MPTVWGIPLSILLWYHTGVGRLVPGPENSRLGVKMKKPVGQMIYEQLVINSEFPTAHRDWENLTDRMQRKFTKIATEVDIDGGIVYLEQLRIARANPAISDIARTVLAISDEESIIEHMEESW
jgi:hypothetical protein